MKSDLSSFWTDALTVGEVFRKKGLPSPTKPYKYTLKALVDPFIYTGIELEIEEFVAPGPPENQDIYKYFKIEQDHSLRGMGAYEIKHASAVHGNKLVRSINTLTEYIKNSGTITKRCSLHVHLNVINLTMSKLQTLILAYIALEKLIYRYTDLDREQNGYCIPIYLTDTEIDYLVDSVFLNLDKKLNTINTYETVDTININIRNCGKYSGLNFRSIYNRGTLEFRMHQGTKDKAEILEWINILHSLCNFAKVQGNTKFVLDFFKIYTQHWTPGDLVEDVFGKLASKISYKNMEEDILEGLITGQELVKNSEFKTSTLYLKV